MCQTTYEELAAFAAGDVDDGANQVLHKHIQGCDHCRRRLEVLRDVDSLLSSLPLYQPSLQQSLQMRQSLARGLQGGEPERQAWMA